ARTDWSVDCPTHNAALWVYFGPRGWELIHIRICVDYAKQNSGNRVFCDRNHMTRAPKSAYRLWGESHRGKNDQVYQAVPRSRDPRLFFFHSMGQARYFPSAFERRAM
ncbi:MAG: hypothetical protein WCC42_09095, partial [Pseudolabrys sp.]